MELAELLERVKAAWGPDRKLDGTIWRAVEGRCPHQSLQRSSADCDDYRDVCLDCGEEDPGDFAPRFTASLDAALALVGRVLPRWEFSLSVEYPGEVAKPVWRVEIGDPLMDLRGTALSPALALITAALEALIYFGGQAAVGEADHG